MFTQTTMKHHHVYSDLKFRGKFQWNRAFFTLSLIIEGATEKILQFVLPMKQINNKKFCFDKQKIMFEHCSVRFKQWTIFKITIFQFFLNLCCSPKNEQFIKKLSVFGHYSFRFNSNYIEQAQTERIPLLPSSPFQSCPLYL